MRIGNTRFTLLCVLTAKDLSVVRCVPYHEPRSKVIGGPVLQSQDALSMVTLGVLGNVAPHHLQPRIADGVHLRWSPGPLRAFPWHGYHLFRREHQPGQPRCVVAPAVEALKEAQATGAATTMLPFGVGQFTSDLPITSTDL